MAVRSTRAWFTVAPHPYVDDFRRGMRELGWMEGEPRRITDALPINDAAYLGANVFERVPL